MNERQQIERTADRLRDELVVTLRELERRRELTLDLSAQLKAHRFLVIGVAAGGVVVLAGGITYAVVHSRSRSHRRRERLQGLVRAWRHPERLASRAADRPLLADLLRKGAAALLTALAAQAAKRSAMRLIPVHA